MHRVLPLLFLLCAAPASAQSPILRALLAGGSAPSAASVGPVPASSCDEGPVSDEATGVYNACDYGFKPLATTGTISAGSSTLTLADASGFAAGDQIIIEAAAVTDTAGVGGYWPGQSVADTTATDPGTTGYYYAAAQDTVTYWDGAAWDIRGNYYEQRPARKALVAQILALSGSVATLNQSAFAGRTDADVYFDNSNTTLEAGYLANASGPSITEVYFPTGRYASSDYITFNSSRADGALVRGAGQFETIIFNPRGTCSKGFFANGVSGATFEDYQLVGTMSDDYWVPECWEVTPGRMHQMEFANGTVVRDVIVRNWEHSLVDVKGSDFVGRWITGIIDECHQRYFQWGLQFADTADGGFHDSKVVAGCLQSAIEPFRSQDAYFARFDGLNAFTSNNSSAATHYEDFYLRYEPESLVNSGGGSASNPAINGNNNADNTVPRYDRIEQGFTITRPVIAFEGYVEEANLDYLTGIAVGPKQWKDVHVLGGLYWIPDSLRSTTVSQIYAVSVRGFLNTDTGHLIDSFVSFSNNNLEDLRIIDEATEGVGRILDSFADSIIADTTSGNGTPAAWLAANTETPVADFTCWKLTGPRAFRCSVYEVQENADPLLDTVTWLVADHEEIALWDWSVDCGSGVEFTDKTRKWTRKLPDVATCDVTLTIEHANGNTDSETKTITVQ